MQEIVIKISEKAYNALTHTEFDANLVVDEMRNSIVHGTVLPKGHGDLIDRNDLLQESYCIDDWSGNEVNIVDTMTVEMAPTIIEADRRANDQRNIEESKQLHNTDC